MSTMMRYRLPIAAIFVVLSAAFITFRIFSWSSPLHPVGNNSGPVTGSLVGDVTAGHDRSHQVKNGGAPSKLESSVDVLRQEVDGDRSGSLPPNSSNSTVRQRIIVKKPPTSDVIQEVTRSEDIGRPYQSTSTDYTRYQVPTIQYTNTVKCSALLDGNPSELAKAAKVMKSQPKVPIFEEAYLEWTKDCKQFRERRGYVQMALSAEEEQFPLAFGISMYTDVEQVERLLRAVYQPQNLYCIHIDTKSSLLTHRTMVAIARCFDNVWIATHLDKVEWGTTSVILPEINCMRDLLRYYHRRFLYFINLTGQEFPLRTNLELVRIARLYNGSNDIGGSILKMNLIRDRVSHIWNHQWSNDYQRTFYYRTSVPKPPFHINVTLFKGELHGLFSRGMVEYIVNNEVARSFFQWCWDTGHASEHYWNTLNYNAFLNAPGGYTGPLDIAHNYTAEPITRAKRWVAFSDSAYNKELCRGKSLRGICVYGVGDLPWLNTRRELFANKFQLTYEYFTLDCLEERHRNRTKSRTVAADFSEQFYANLPTVKYSRKDGLT